MQRPQARNLLPLFKDNHFLDVRIDTEMTGNFGSRIAAGWVIIGRGYFDSVNPVPFSIRSVRDAYRILERYGPRQPIPEVQEAADAH